MTAIPRTLVTEQVADREHSDFRALVEEHKRGVYRLALDLTGDHDDAEDLSQEVFLKAYRGLEAFRGEASHLTWLRRITVNTFLNSTRRNRLSLVRLESDESAPESVVSEQAESPVDSVRLRAEIDRALGRLSQGERTAFVLRHYQDLQIREVGLMMGVAEGTVKSFLFRGTQKMAGLLAHLRMEIQS